MRRRYITKGYIKILISILILGLAACSGNTIRPITETMASVTLTPQNIPATTAIAATQTEFVTRTPVSTLPAEEVVSRALELLRTNAGCSLPCWWGITPDVSTIEEAQQILEPFLGAIVRETEFEFPEAGYYFMSPLPNGLEVGIEVLAKDNLVSLIYIKTDMTSGIYTKVYDDPIYQEIMSAYTLEAMLTNYGKPDQILIRSFSGLTGEFNPTQTLLYYPKLGIVVQYFSPNGLLIENDAFVIPTCPPRSHISMRLFDPNSQMNLNQILAIDDSFSKYKDISEATNMDIEAFFQAYHEYDEKTLESRCPATLKTPENLWPSEYQNP